MHNQAYIEGFVKRASEYGFNENEALELLQKHAAPIMGTKGVRPAQNLGMRKGRINEAGLHVPPDKGSYLSRISHSIETGEHDTPIKKHLERLREEHDLDDVANSFSR